MVNSRKECIKRNMTKFQALFVLYLRHAKFCGCSWRATAANYYNRYNFDGTFKDINKRVEFKWFTYGGNQLDGIFLEEEAFKILVPDSLITEPVDLYEISLEKIHSSFNLKKHLK